MRVSHKGSKNFGPKVRARRKELGLTLTALAELVNTSKSHLSDIERGVSANTSFEMVARISNALGANIVIEAPLKKGTGAPLAYQSPFSFEQTSADGKAKRLNPTARLVGEVLSDPDIPEILRRVLSRQIKALIAAVRAEAR